MQPCGFLASGRPAFDCFKHRQDGLRLSGFRTDRQKVFQAFAAFVAHTRIVVAAVTGFKGTTHTPRAGFVPAADHVVFEIATLKRQLS